MKVKKFNKKLTLSRETVANLDNEAMSGVKGGFLTAQDTCEGACDTFVTCGRATWCEC